MISAGATAPLHAGVTTPRGLTPSRARLAGPERDRTQSATTKRKRTNSRAQTTSISMVVLLPLRYVYCSLPAVGRAGGSSLVAACIMLKSKLAYGCHNTFGAPPHLAGGRAISISSGISGCLVAILDQGSRAPQQVARPPLTLSSKARADLWGGVLSHPWHAARTVWRYGPCVRGV